MVDTRTLWPTYPSLLHLNCGDTIERKIRSGDGQLSQWLKSKLSNEDIVRVIFRTALARAPKDTELSTIKRVINEADSRDDAIRDVFWAVLNSKEFAFNH